MAQDKYVAAMKKLLKERMKGSSVSQETVRKHMSRIVKNRSRKK